MPARNPVRHPSERPDRCPPVTVTARRPGAGSPSVRRVPYERGDLYGRRCAWRALLVASALLGQAEALSGQATGAVASHPEVVAALRLFEIWAGEQLAYYHQPGIAVGVVVDQDLVWATGFGSRDVGRALPATPQTVYRIASITKTFTATAVMQLRDAGKLRLDEPVATYLPWFVYRDTFPDAPPVTIRDLLTHTSGLPREADFAYWTDRQFPTREALIEALHSQVGVFAPGTRYKYSNLGLAIAGEIVAAVAGLPYDQYVQRHILEPLGMTSTWVRFEDVDTSRLATGYEIRRPDGSQPVAGLTIAQGLTPAANMSSTVNDLARFLALQFRDGPASGSQILRGSTLREMHRVHWLGDDWDNGRGLGFSVWRQGDRTLVGHGGWVAGYRTQIAFDPAARVGVVVLTNSDERGPGRYVRTLFDLVVPALERAAARPDTAAPSMPEVDRYLGRYRDPSGWETDVVTLGGKLWLYDHGYPPRDDPMAGLTELAPLAPDTFRMTGENGNGELLAFERGADGRVARVKVGANYIFPTECGRIVGLVCAGR